ncbi:MAG: phosphatase PAP2 family protein [Rhodoferax sp.]
MKAPAGIAVSVWLLPLGLLLLAAPLWLHWVEPALFLALNAFCAGLPAVLWASLSLLGNGWGVLGATAPLLLLAPRLMLAWLCAAPFAIGLTRLGKGWIESARPAALLDHAQMQIVGEALYKVSMPSGHTLTAFAVASALYFALPAASRWRQGWLFALAAAVGLSRVAVGAHWPGDVAVGACLGLLSGMLAQLLLGRIGPQHWQPGSWSLRLVALLLLLAAFHLASEALDFAEAQPMQYVLVGVILGTLLLFVRRQWRRASASA